MRIAYFSDTFIPQINGVSNTLSYLKRYLDKKGVDYRFHVPDYDDMLLKADANVICSKGMALPDYRDCKLTLPWMPRLSGDMDAFRPSLIHLVTEFGIGIMGRTYARARKLPIVSSYHTNIDQYARYYPSLSPLKQNVKDYFKWFHRRSRRVFVPTDDTREHLQSMGFERLSIWSRGIDTVLFSPEKRSRAFRAQHGLEGKTVILYVGRVAAEKDIGLLPEIMRRVQAKNKNAVLVVTGDGPQLSQLKDEAPEGSVFTGFLRGEPLAQAYASSDIFLTPSSTETFGNVALEAMASGLPVVAADAGGLKNIVHHGSNGLLSAPHQAEAFADALSLLLAKPALSADMGQQAVQTAEKRSWDSVFAGLLADYEVALAERAAS
jgi:glycosyltransferase involved in cell wall biosynthesis